MNDRLTIPSEALAAICRRYGVCELSLFGSAATGRLRPGSDVDLLVVFDGTVRVGLVSLARMQRELSELIGRSVDLVPKDGLKPALRDEVLAQAQLVYAA